MSVNFDVLAEFFEEMERDALDEEIAHKIVRTSARRETNSTGSGSDLSTVVAYRARGDTVQCVVKRGDAWPSTVHQQLATDKKAIEDFCQQHGLDLRGGYFR